MVPLFVLSGQADATGAGLRHGQGGGLQDTEHHWALVQRWGSVGRAGWRRAGFGALRNSTDWAVWWWVSALGSGCLPFLRLLPQLGLTHSRKQEMLKAEDNKQRPRESCLLRVTAFLREWQINICLGTCVPWSLDSGPLWVSLSKSASAPTSVKWE